MRNPNKTSRTSLRILSILVLSSCAQVKLKDSEFCAGLPDGSATCVHMLSDATRDIPQPQWDIERVGEICETSAAFADLKGAIEKLCHMTGKCTMDQKKQMAQFFDKIGRISRGNGH